MTNETEVKDVPISSEGKLDPIFGRMDLIAILMTVLGACILGIAAVVLTIVEFFKLVSGLWSDSFDRWLMLAFGLMVAWVIVRWRRLCVF